MESPKPQLTPELRQALQDRPGQPIHIEDAETDKVYLLIEQGVVPTLDNQYIGEGLELAREQIESGETSNRPIGDVIREAQRRHSS